MVYAIVNVNRRDTALVDDAGYPHMYENKARAEEISATIPDSMVVPF